MDLCIKLETICSIRVVEGVEVKEESFIALVQVNHLLPEQLIQILVLQHRLPQNEQLQEYGDQKLLKTLSKFVVFFHLKLIHVTFVAWFMTILQFGLPRL